MELTDQDLRAVQDVIGDAHEAQNDVEALLALHTPDAVVVNIAGRRVLGRDEFGRVMSAALASPLADVRTSVEVVDARPITPDTALVSCIKSVHDLRDEGHAPVPAQGALTYVMTRRDGQWRIACAQTTPLPAAVPAGSSPADSSRAIERER